MGKYTGSTEAENVFMKQQTFLEESDYNDSRYANLTAQEISRCEEVAANPHENLARYLGVETEVISGVERVIRIAYKRYTMDLDTFVLEKRLLKKDNLDLIVQGLRNGMQHLHKLGLVHCDLWPLNVFVTCREEDGKLMLKEVVIGDFDASLKIGEPVALKRACEESWPPEVKWRDLAAPHIDQWSLQKMENWLGDWLKENGLDEYVRDSAAYTSPLWPDPSDSSDAETADETVDDLQGNGPIEW
ncbi:hypothetical protein B5807_12013 [Epicoccum nigrum]|uniref:Protein kinase domain-containing protein n=1 Tax=Epicoccum nigrum TaxID=105696 RepID=A0A1Y2LHN7_EPING|nr:hypothetical protein B5807_12013 [Epicoccum nigrum]